MGMRIEYTIFLMMRLKSFRPKLIKIGSPGENAKNIKKSLQNSYKDNDESLKFQIDLQYRNPSIKMII
jgi:hypothetical protein